MLLSNENSRNSIALVCDWLTTPGGAEKVLLELHRMYPDAPIYTSQYNPKKIDWFQDAKVHTGWLQIFPSSFRKILGPLRQLYFSHLDLSHYDLVISVTGAEAKSVRTTPKLKKSPQSSRNPKPTHPQQRKSPKSNKNPNAILSERLTSQSYHTSSKKSIAIEVPTPRPAFHLCYCHVPTQYYWQMYDKYLKNPGFGFLNPLVRFFFKLLVKPLRKADYKAAQRPDQFVTISHYAADQIQQYYHREAKIIAPPVDIAKFSTEKSTNFSTNFSTETPPKSTKNSDFSTANPQSKPNFYTNLPQPGYKFSTAKVSTITAAPVTSTASMVSPEATASDTPSADLAPFIISCRQATWKRVDLAISACLETNSPLTVIGDGSEHARLVKLANSSPLIEFLPWLDSASLAKHLQSARAYLFPSLEPFGIAAVEALAAGCPVIAYAEGGSRDFIDPGLSGLLFSDQTVHSLTSAIHEFESMSFDRATVAASAAKFRPAAFREQITALVDRELPNLALINHSSGSDHA